MSCVWISGEFLALTPQSIKYRLGMELRPRSGINGSQAKPRATSLGMGAERDENKVDDAANKTLVNSHSLATGATRDGESSSRIHPVEGGLTRTSIPLPRSESAGGAVRSPEGDPPSRRDQPGNTATWAGELRPIDYL